MREADFLQLTEAQFSILDMARTIPKFAILGAAGCGKEFVKKLVNVGAHSSE